MGPEVVNWSLQSGEHLCIFGSGEPIELVPGLLDFLRSGLDAGERCVLVAPGAEADALAALLGPAAAASSKGAIEVWPATRWLRTVVGTEGSLAAFMGLVEQAAGEGRTGLRVVVDLSEPTGALNPGALRQWEAALSALSPRPTVRIMCRYPERQPAEVVDAGLCTHRLVAVESRLYANPFYEAPLAARPGADPGGMDWRLARIRECAAPAGGGLPAIQAAAIVETSADAIFARDLGGTILSWNPAAERIFGYAAADAIGRPIAMLIPDDRREEEREVIARVANGDRIEPFETVRWRSDGTMVPVAMTVSPVLDHDGRIVGVSKIARDITDQKARDERIRGIDAARLRELVTTSEAVTGSDELVELLQRIAVRARELADADFAAISVFGIEGALERFIYTGMSDDQARRLGNPPIGRGLLGALSTYSSALRLDDLTRHERYTGWPDGHPDMAAFLGVPIRAGGETIGSLYMTRLRGRKPFDETDELEATMLALHVAVAVSGAIAHERRRRVSLLEERVGIGHDLHDGMVQSLYALALQWDVLLADPDVAPEALRPALEQGIQGVREVIGEIRQYISSLEFETFSASVELQGDLSRLLDRLVPSGVHAILRVSAPALQELSMRQAEDLLFIAREAVSNAVRHGQPTKIAVDLRQTADEIALTVQDNGSGFDSDSSRVGLGTVTTRTRAERIGGELSVLSVPGMGTTVRVSMPRKMEEDR